MENGRGEMKNFYYSSSRPEEKWIRVHVGQTAETIGTSAFGFFAQIFRLRIENEPFIELPTSKNAEKSFRIVLKKIENVWHAVVAVRIRGKFLKYKFTY